MVATIRSRYCPLHLFRFPLFHNHLLGPVYCPFHFVLLLQVYAYALTFLIYLSVLYSLFPKCACQFCKYWSLSTYIFSSLVIISLCCLLLPSKEKFLFFLKSELLYRFRLGYHFCETLADLQLITTQYRLNTWRLCPGSQCYEPYFSYPFPWQHSAPNAPFRLSKQVSSFNSTSICSPTFKAVRTSLITQLPVTVHPVGSPWSLDREESKTTMHICTSMAQDIILRSIGALINPMT